MAHYYFETLPLHPQPKRLESFTSYLIRLAEANSIGNRDKLALFFRPVSIQTLADYPSALLSKLQMLAQCSEMGLLGTTFYHVGRKFGRSSLPQSLAIFLQGTVAQSLRYCPICLINYGYYFLTWRFLILNGCYEHSCQLLNECGHCGSTIPIFGSLLKIAICPVCKGDLRECSPKPLTEEERWKAFLSTQELDFLLSPQPWEDEYSSIAEMIGHELAFLRKKEQKTIKDVIKSTGIPPWNLEVMESGFKSKSRYGENKSKYIGTSFRWYLKYVSHLGITLRTLFDMVLQREMQERESHMWQKETLLVQNEAALVQKEILGRVEEAIQRLNSLKLPVTQKSVLKIVGMASVKKFKEQISAMIYDYNIKQAQVRADKLFSDVQSAVEQLENLKRPVTRRAIADIVSVSPDGFRYYPQIVSFLNERGNYLEHQRRENQLREGELLMKVEAAIKKLEDEDRAVTYRAVGEIVGMEPGNFKYYPHVRTLLEQKNNYFQYRRRNTQLHEDELLTKVEAAVLHLEASGQALTYLAIGEIVGMHPSGLNRYPRIRTLLVQKINVYHPRQDIRDIGLRENDLLVKVEAVVSQLEKLGTPVTQRAISEAIGMAPGQLELYPQIKILLEKHGSYYQHLSIQSRTREDDLLDKIKDAVQLLKDLDRPVTQHAISELIGIPSNGLWRYSRLKKQIEQEVILHSLYNEAPLQLGEEELMKKILEVKSTLDSSGQPATPGTIRKLLGIESSFLKCYPQVNAFLHSLEKQDVKRRGRLYEDELLIRVETAVQELRNCQQPITQTNIARKINCSTSTLRRYPRVLDFVMGFVKQEKQKVTAMYRQQKEEKIEKDVLEAVQQLQMLNQRVTINAICQIVQIHRNTIISYPALNEVLDGLIKSRQKTLLRRDS